MLFCAFDNDGDGTVAAKEFAKHLSDVKTEKKTKRERLAREDNSYFLERKLEREAAVVAKHRKQAQVAVAATWVMRTATEGCGSWKPLPVSGRPHPRAATRPLLRGRALTPSSFWQQLAWF